MKKYYLIGDANKGGEIIFWGLLAMELCLAFVAAVDSTPCHFAALIPVGYYCPSASPWGKNLFSTFIEAEISSKNISCNK